MKKNILVAAVLFVLLASSSVHALGLGASFGAPFGGSGVNPGTALSLKLDQKSPVYGLGLTVSGSYFRLGATADIWMTKGKLIDFLGYYAGPGAYVGLSSTSIDLGARIPVGVNAYLLNNSLEFFVEIAPALGVGLSNPVTFPVFQLQNAIGFRFWF